MAKLAIGAKRLASDAYNFVKRGFQIMAYGIRFVLTPELYAYNNAPANQGESPILGLRKNADMDTTIIVAPNAKASAIDAFWEKMAAMRLRARAAMALANLIISEAVRVIRDGVFKGPLAIVSLLIRLYKMRNSDTFSLLKKAYASYD